MARPLISQIAVRFLKKAWPVLKESISEWSNDKCPRLGAALSYYTMFSLAPLLIVAIAVAGFFLGPDAARGEIVEQLTDTIGHDAASFLQTAIINVHHQAHGLRASIIGVITLLVGASGVMIELQDALNTVWKVVPRPGAGWKLFVRARLLSFALVLSLGFLLLVSFVMSAALEAAVGWANGYLPRWIALGYVVNYVVSIGMIALFLALLFKVLPDVHVGWKAVWLGGLVASLLFHLGKYGIALYIGRASVGSAFGAAGSLAVLLVWVYYSSQIVLWGAELTRAYANQCGAGVRPDENAVESPHGAAERLGFEKGIKEAMKPPRHAPT